MNSTIQPLIECNSLGKQFKGRLHSLYAVKDVSLQIKENEIVLIKGRSGAGKSTLLNLMCGLIKPTEGRIRIGDNYINELNNRSLSNLLLNRIGIIFQNFNLLPTYNVYENIEVALEPKGIKPEKMKRKIMELLDQFGLSDKISLMPSELSIGQQQKVAIVRTIAKEPSVLFADEPTGSVDEVTAEEILNYIRYLKNEKKATIIIASHGSVPDSFADRVLVMENGSMKS